MEIQALRLLITDQDLNDLVAKHLPTDQEIRKVRVCILPEGVQVSGVYHMLVNVNFETLWKLGIGNGMLTIHLDKFKALGVPASIFKSMVMTAIRDALSDEDLVQIEDETVVVNFDHLAGREGVSLRTHLKRVTCLQGSFLIESGI